jgi:phosphoribosylaminoimidazole-succinocarboxamide synthase
MITAPPANALVETLPPTALTNSQFEERGGRLLNRGKVRDLYDVGEDRMLIIATDRLSAFDVVMKEGLPGKGIILTQMSRLWFAATQEIVPNHLLDDEDTALPALLSEADTPELGPRCMLVRKLHPLPVEAVVRGYLAGSGFKEYQRTGAVCGEPLPPGLTEAAALPEPIFTPSTKATASGHDEPISRAELVDHIGGERASAIEYMSLSLYNFARDRAASAGILLADTKFEFGEDETGRLYLIDEALTPDSSRFWPAQGYVPGQPQPSFDKQFVRDFLISTGWHQSPPPPSLPQEVLEGTRGRYLEAYRRLESVLR